MRLPINVTTPLLKPPHEIRTFANNLVEDVDWSHNDACKVSGQQHRRSENRYNERVVEQLFVPRAYVRVRQHGRHFDSRSKLVCPYSGLSEVVEFKGPVLTLLELDT